MNGSTKKMSLPNFSEDKIIKRYIKLYVEKEKWNEGAALQYFTPFYPNYVLDSLDGYNKEWIIAVCSGQDARYLELQGHPKDNIVIFADNQLRMDFYTERGYKVEMCNPFTKDKSKDDAGDEASKDDSTGFEEIILWKDQKSYIYRKYKDYFDHSMFCNLYASQKNPHIGKTYLGIVRQITKPGHPYTLAQTPQGLIKAIEEKHDLISYALSDLENRKDKGRQKGGGYIMTTYIKDSAHTSEPRLLKPHSPADPIDHEILEKLIRFKEWNDYELTGSYSQPIKGKGNVAIGLSKLSHAPLQWGHSTDPKMLTPGPKVIMNKWLNNSRACFIGTTAPCLIPTTLVIDGHRSWSTVEHALHMAAWLHVNPIRIYVQLKFGFSRNTLIRFLKAFDINEIVDTLDFPGSYKLSDVHKAHINKYKLTRSVDKNGKEKWKRSELHKSYTKKSKKSKKS